MKVRHVVTVTAVLAALAACKADNKVLQTWIGAPDTRLVSVWGAPSNIVETQQGTRILTYRKEGEDSAAGASGGNDLLPAAGDGAQQPAYCETTFTVQDHRIVAFVRSGPSC